MMNHLVDRILGIFFWLALIVCGFVMLQSVPDPNTETTGVSLVHYFYRSTTKVEALDRSAQLCIGDPIFYQGAGGKWSQIGFVESIPIEAGGAPILLSWYSQDVLPAQCRLVRYRNSGRLEDVVATMLSPEKKAQIKKRLASAMRLHGDDLSAAFVPLVEASLRRSLPVIEGEFRRAVDRHRTEIGQLAHRWNEEVVSQRLLPLVRREVLPIVRTHGRPTADAIGRELWDRASLWSFAWRAVYDKSPLPRKDLVQKEWDKFVKEQAIPVFEAHMDDIVVTIQRIFNDVAISAKVRSEMAEVAGDIAEDREARQLVRVILKETLIENEQLRDVWRHIWTGKQGQRVLNMASERLEPVVRGIGDDLFGTREDGINPNFARVLRNQILGKDRRWIVAERIDDSVASLPMTIVVSNRSMPYPIVYMANRHNGGSGAE